MKRILPYIIFWTIAILAAACSGEEEPLRGNPIGFSASEEMPVRGTAYNTTWSTVNGSAFDVVAYYYALGSLVAQPLLENTVTRDGTKWGYSPVVYWPVEGTVDFFAYAPACEGARKEIQRFTPSHTDYQTILVDCHVPASEITTVHSLGTDNVPITAFPHDAAKQYDLMFSSLRDVPCDEQSVTSRVNMQFVHSMAGVDVDLSALAENAATKIPVGTGRIVVGIGRIKTGGTLAICEPATPGRLCDVRWTLDGLEGTFYETYQVTYDQNQVINGIIRDRTGKPGDMRDVDWEAAGTFFVPPQQFESPLVVSVYFYSSGGLRLSYRSFNLPTTGDDAVTALKRGEILNINIR